MSGRVLIGILLLGAGAVSAPAQSSSLYQRERIAAVEAARSPEPLAPAGRLSPASSFIALEIPKPQTFQKFDLVTVIIREQAQHATAGATKTSRDSSIDGGVNAWTSLHLAGGTLRLEPTAFPEGKPRVKADMTRDFDGSARATRQDSLSARVQAQIIDIKPNGNLVLQASKRVQTDEECYTITVTGTCRTRDITPDNTVLSTQIAELEVVKISSGPSKDATKRGWFHKVLDAVNLF